jgi:predicted transcriptional regulator
MSHDPPQLQDEVLAILADHDLATVRDVVDQLRPPRAFTTVATVLSRLLDQGRVSRVSVDGRWAYRLAPAHNRMLGERIASLLDRVAGDPEPLLQALVGGVEEIDPALLDRLEALIASRRRERA